MGPLMNVLLVIYLGRLVSSALQPRSDVTLLSTIHLKDRCDVTSWKLTQHESYQILWEGDGIQGECKMSFLAENPYNVATDYKVCFRFLVFDLKDCETKVRLSESSWMHLNYVYDTRKYDCGDSLPIDEWCSGWHSQAWFSLFTLSFPTYGKFRLEVTAEANTNLSKAACAAIVLSCLGGLFFLSMLSRWAKVKRRRTRENNRHLLFSNLRNMRLNPPNQMLLDPTAPAQTRTRDPPSPPSIPHLRFDTFPSPFSSLRPAVNRRRSPSPSIISNSSPVDDDHGQDATPLSNQISNQPPSYHTVIPQDDTGDLPPSDQTDPAPPPDEPHNIPPPPYNTVDPPSYEECMQYAITWT